MREAGGLVEEQVLHDDTFHFAHRGGDVQRIGIGLRKILALYVHALEAAIERRLEHVWNAQARISEQIHTPRGLEELTGLGIRNVPVTAEFMRERTHVTGALHVVLAAQRADADALATEI